MVCDRPESPFTLPSACRHCHHLGYREHPGIEHRAQRPRRLPLMPEVDQAHRKLGPTHDGIEHSLSVRPPLHDLVGHPLPRPRHPPAPSCRQLVTARHVQRPTITEQERPGLSWLHQGHDVRRAMVPSSGPPLHPLPVAPTDGAHRADLASHQVRGSHGHCASPGDRPSQTIQGPGICGHHLRGPGRQVTVVPGFQADAEPGTDAFTTPRHPRLCPFPCGWRWPDR
jgi:hypothetical protein